MRIYQIFLLVAVLAFTSEAVKSASRDNEKWRHVDRDIRPDLVSLTIQKCKAYARTETIKVMSGYQSTERPPQVVVIQDSQPSGYDTSCRENAYGNIDCKTRPSSNYGINSSGFSGFTAPNYSINQQNNGYKLGQSFGRALGGGMNNQQAIAYATNQSFQEQCMAENGFIKR